MSAVQSLGPCRSVQFDQHVRSPLAPRFDDSGSSKIRMRMEP
jgi:hypothetical protein